MIDADDIEQLAQWVFKKIFGTAISESIKSKFSKRVGEKLEMLAKEKKYDDFMDKFEDILETGEGIKQELLKLQRGGPENYNGITQNGNGNIGQNYGSITNNYFSSVDHKDYEKNYTKALNFIKDDSCEEAINYLQKFIREADDEKDAKLLLIACEIYSKKPNNNKVFEYISLLNRDKYIKNFFPLILLGLLHIEYKNRHLRMDEGLTIDEVKERLKLLKKDSTYNSVLKLLKKNCSLESEKFLDSVI